MPEFQVSDAIPKIIAHRGASVAFPENTVQAFVGARTLGADGSELDVRRTGDGVLVVHHDAHLADGRLIRSLAREELPGFVPTLEEVFDAVDGHFLNVEIKNHDHEPDFDADQEVAIAVVDFLVQRAVSERVLVSSFDFATIQAVRSAGPEIKTGWLFWDDPDRGGANANREIERAVAHGVDSVNPHDPLVDAAVVQAAHEAGLTVNVWTVDEPDRLRELASFGVDSLITNVPDIARQALA